MRGALRAPAGATPDGPRRVPDEPQSGAQGRRACGAELLVSGGGPTPSSARTRSIGRSNRRSQSWSTSHSQRRPRRNPSRISRPSADDLFQIYWFFMAWVGYTIFFLPRISRVPDGQLFLINALFYLCLFTGLGALVGIYAGQTGMITGSAAYWFGSQGWEFMELGRFFQYTPLGSFAPWIFII